MPLIEIARTKTKDEAMAALDTWRARHPAAAERLQPADILVDGMRGPSSIWYRIRINLQHVPDGQRPPQEELIADYSPWRRNSRPGHQGGPHAAGLSAKPRGAAGQSRDAILSRDATGWNRRGFLRPAGPRDCSRPGRRAARVVEPKPAAAGGGGAGDDHPSFR